MATYVYELGDNLYINLTNKCTNNCTFCVRRQGDDMAGYDLRLDGDAKAEDVIGELGKKDLSRYKYVVFCGYGEPTMNLEALLQVARYVKERGAVTKLNTNGHGSKVNGRDIVPELMGLIDVVSISLNDCDGKNYNKVSLSQYGEDGFAIMVDFVRACAGKFPKVVVTVVDVIPKERIEKCEQLAAELGVLFRLRHYQKY